MNSSPRASWVNLLYATLSLALGFAAWGLISGFATSFRADLHLSAQSTALLVAVPVLLGSSRGIPVGLLTDRFGGRIVFTGLFLLVAVPGVDHALGVYLPRAPRVRVLPRASRVHRLPPAWGSRRAGFRRRCREPRSASTGSATWGIRPPCSWGLSSPRTIPAVPSFEAVAVLCAVWAIGLLSARARRAGEGQTGLGRRDDPGPHHGAAVLGPRRLLLPHVRGLRRVFGLPADAAAGRVRPDAGRRGAPHRRFRRARDVDAAARRHPVRSPRRRARAVRGVCGRRCRSRCC